MRKVVILRGVPGSGKTHGAKKIAELLADQNIQSETCSADDFFLVTLPDGSILYNFNPHKLAEAHADCMKRFLEHLLNDVPVVIVDNTNIKHWEYRNYITAAWLAKYDVEVIEIVARTVDDIRKFAGRNTHNVPLEIVARMAVEFESTDKAFKRDELFGVEIEQVIHDIGGQPAS